jgi:hypothetical protein
MKSKRRYMHGKRRRRSPILSVSEELLEAGANKELVEAGVILGESLKGKAHEFVGDIKSEELDVDLTTDADFSKLKKKKPKSKKTVMPDPKTEIKVKGASNPSWAQSGGGFGPKPPTLPK